jgi:LPPG:FO 2-phospho-L-lactate transferase
MTRVVVLTGGVGGAKLVLGLCHVVPPQAVTSIVNTGDDFRHLGLAISPDMDTLLYTLAGKGDAEKGWGRGHESWSFMAALASLGGDQWFQLGDGDLALHVLRSQALGQGEALSTITARFAAAWGVASKMLPMSDDPVATMLTTDAGELDFQTYFVARRGAPIASAIRFAGAANARPAPGVLAAIEQAEIILIAPSNPYLSIDPILAVPGIAAALAAAPAKVVAVSPLISGQAVKGPTAKLMQELGLPLSNKTIAAHYAGIIDALLIDSGDQNEDPGIAFAATDTLMRDLADRQRVAAACLALARTL